MRQLSTHFIPSHRPHLQRLEVLERGLGIRPSRRDRIRNRMRIYAVIDHSQQIGPDLDDPFPQADAQHNLIVTEIVLAAVEVCNG